MKRRRFSILFGAAVLAVLCACAVPPSISAEPHMKVLAHYMPWFKAEPTADGQILWDHWEWYGKGPKHDPDEILANGRHDIASVYYPLIGPYDGRDPGVLTYHFLTARAAGIEGFIADWYGPNSYSDGVFSGMVHAAERYRMKVAICLEEKSFFPGYSRAGTRADALDVAEEQIRHVLTHYASSPAYLREDGRPVFYMFNNYKQGVLGLHSLTPEELENLLNRFTEDPIFFVRGEIDPAYADVADGAFAWVGDESYRTNFYTTAHALLPDHRLSYIAGSAMPGFDDTGVWGWGNGPRVIPRRGTKEYDDHWRDVLKEQPDAVQVVTWNDFQEGSTIEPSFEYKFTYVDRTEEWVHRLTGRAVHRKDNRWPYRLYVMRRQILQFKNARKRRQMTIKLDNLEEDLARKRTFLMGLRLAWTEFIIRRHLPASKGNPS